MKISPRQNKYIRWMVSAVGLDDDARRDLMEAETGVRSMKELDHGAAKKLVRRLQAECRKVGITPTSKKEYRRSLASKGRKNGMASSRQVNMLWTLAKILNMNDITFMGFLKKKITDNRTGNPAELTNREVTHAKNALEARIERGDTLKVPKRRLVGREGNVLKVNFGG